MDSELYGDLEAHSEELENTKDELKKELLKNVELKNQLNDAEIQIAKLVEEKSQLEINIVKVFNTAMLEIQRKDKRINELQEKRRKR